MKATVEQIRQRFDADVERFSNLEIGQTTMVDAQLVMGLVTQAAAATTPAARQLLDIGCGAGNYTLMLLQALPGRDVTLVDLSRPMLERATQRVAAAGAGQITAIQADIREAPLGEAQFDIILAAAVFHHLRSDAEWRAVFAKCHAALRPGGALWIADLVEHEASGVQAMMWQRYGDYLVRLKDSAYRDHVFAYVAEEDTPRSLPYQLELLAAVGFAKVEVLHKNGCFAAFGAVKHPQSSV